MLNLKHLHYFWAVAKQGGVTRASEHLHLTPQTISGQITRLEEQLGETLFNRVGRTLILTEVGRVVLSYADEIFSLSGELEEIIRGMPEDRPMQFRVGVADVVPKSIAHRLLAPALNIPESLRIICREGDLNSLLAELAVHRIDLVIADGPIPSHVNVRGFSHELGNCGISFFAEHKLSRQLNQNFPENLNNQPLLIPGEGTMLRNQLMQWLDTKHIYPRIVGEFEDSALMKAFGRAGAGVFIAPTPIADEVAKQYNVKIIGQTNEISDQFYAITVERKISHPAVSVITTAAREWLET